jgi:uncharacterized protein with HEPN domain
MPFRHDPVESLADIIENADRIEGYIAGMERADFERNGLVRDAVERCLERICEAAYRLGEQADVLIPTQPWGEIRSMGNRLRHGYDRIDLKVVWDTVRIRLPSLEADARQVLARLRAEDSPSG